MTHQHQGVQFSGCCSCWLTVTLDTNTAIINFRGAVMQIIIFHVSIFFLAVVVVLWLWLWRLTTPDWVYRKHCSGNIQHWTVSVRTAQIILCLVNVCCSTDKQQLWILSYLWPVCIKKRYINYTLHMKRYWTNSFSLTTRGSPLHVIYPGFF